jgi:hypothetical protein
MRDLGAGMQSRPDISWSSRVTAVVQWASALDNGNVLPKRGDAFIMVAGSGATFFDEGPPAATQSLWQVRALDCQGMGKSSAMGQEPTHIRPRHLADAAPIAVSFHRLFLGAGCFPAEPASTFAGYAMESGGHILSRQAHASGSSMPAEKIHTPNDHRLTRPTLLQCRYRREWAMCGLPQGSKLALRKRQTR